MWTSLRLPVFGLLMIAQTCSVSECVAGCGKVDHRGNGSTIEIGKALSFSAQCSTCSHANISATWLARLESYGEVTLTIRATCRDGLATTAEDVTVQVKAQTASINDRGVIVPCGENADVTWTAWLTNNTSDAIDQPRFNVSCPNAGYSSGALGPSAIR